MNNTLPRFTYFYTIISALFVFFLLQISPVLAQKKMSLNDVLEQAQKNSPQAKIATTTFKNRFWSYQTFKTNYLPQLRFNATVPDLARS